ncbi:multiple resistance and pH regulation protein F [Beutenbergia cavernae DSM 12333]|uniref:Multiple resistance and pH regulation protein F n=1 Tax=Beutenbergia cavernae (strain ATCC BAA-8 / DSM 12333 / CCUG 43141 / JCM 11478 / NBRC 16432 / NCIMB 13614 / HKI 0122) TaxID=471853 RepID=C5C4D2_BEUC1|nr:monovalent cation/H+ antiporter complex subunit F [Beutenbergia cavernae]ACQ82056.1 multiple resistance and pH regulation protein F [Beutenbergia cavernae DSM 12333]
MSVWVMVACGLMVTVGAVLALSRIERGPSMLDRIVAVDVLVATVLATMILVSAWTHRTDLVPVMVVLTLVGFVGSVSIARFAATESDEERRILTAEEIEAERQRADARGSDVEEEES